MALKLEQAATAYKVLREITSHKNTVLHREHNGSVQLLLASPVPGSNPETGTVSISGSGPGSGSDL